MSYATAPLWGRLSAITVLLIGLFAFSTCTNEPAYAEDDSFMHQAVLSDYEDTCTDIQDVRECYRDTSRLNAVREKAPYLAKVLTELKDVQSVNKFINTFRYIGEPEGADHWDSTLEFLTPGGAGYGRDCEDFALMKYRILKEKYDVKILVAYRYTRNHWQGHAVLLLNRVWILDINTDGVYTYETFLQMGWNPDRTYDDKGVQHVWTGEESD